jgi:hypothetical protein
VSLGHQHHMDLDQLQELHQRHSQVLVLLQAVAGWST